jgi:putative endopeptidase
MKTLLGLAALGAAAAIGLGAIAAPQIAPWGFDLAGRDISVSPGTDFNGYANGDYLKKLVIPADRSRYGAFDALQALSETRVHGILEQAAADPGATGDAGKIGAFYRAFMDERRADALGARPIAPELAAIRAATSREALARLMGEGSRGFYGSFFEVDTGVDAKDPDHYAIYVGQSGLGLPDRDYYLEASFAPQKAKYQAYVAQMLKLASR